MNAEERQQACAAQHFGLWLIEPTWFAQAVQAVRRGLYVPVAVKPQAQGPGEETAPYQVEDGGVARIALHGQMQKGQSSFGGTSTVGARRAIRRAVTDEDVSAIMLHVDSPGGTVAGTHELAAEVSRANGHKPVHAYIEDTGASAAYWIASQARRLTMNPTGLAGSIGTLAVLEDTSGKMEKEGVKVHVLSTGPFKGAGWPGTEFTEEQIEHWQGIVDALNEHFLKAVRQGRGVSAAAVKGWADGRMHVGAAAVELGMVDAVEPYEKAQKAAARAGRSERRARDTVAANMKLRVAELK